MILSAAEQQLVRIIRSASSHNLTLTVRVRDRRYSVRLATHDSGPGTGLKFGPAARNNCLPATSPKATKKRPFRPT